MRKLFISAGHSAKEGADRGASGNGYFEGVLTAEFRTLLVAECKKLGLAPIVDGDSTILNETFKTFKVVANPDCIMMDIHFNAGPPAATGAEVLVPAIPTEFEKLVADKISAMISNTLGIRNRGVKTELDSARKKLLWMELPGNNILLEICFISNKLDMEYYQANKALLAERIATYLKAIL